MGGVGGKSATVLQPRTTRYGPGNNGLPVVVSACVSIMLHTLAAFPSFEKQHPTL